MNVDEVPTEYLTALETETLNTEYIYTPQAQNKLMRLLGTLLIIHQNCVHSQDK